MTMEGRFLLVGLFLVLLTCLLQAQPAPDLTTTGQLTPRTSAPPTLTTTHPSGHLQADERAASGVDEDTTRWEVVGACSATCVEQTLEWPPSDDQCLQDHDCLTCWQLCELLYKDELKWRSMCTEPSCTIGCRTACKFSFNTVLLPDNLPWEFLTTPTTVEVSDSALDVSWEMPGPRPLPKVKTRPQGRPYLVYTLLFKDDSTQHWSKVTATLDQTTQVDGPHASFPGLSFLIIASSPTSTMARGVPPYPALPATTTTTSVPSARPSPINQSLSVYVTTTVEGKLEAEVAWFQETLPEPDVRRPRWVITWRRVTCNVDPSSVHCPLTEEEVTAHINSKDTQDMRVRLTDLTFNSEYILSLYLEDSSLVATPSAFYTPACPHLDATFMTCRTWHTQGPPVGSRETTHKQTNAPTTTMDRRDVPVYQRISQQEERPTSLALTPQVFLMSVAVSLGSVLVLLVSLCVYRRWCRRTQELNMAKVMQSYSQLPLLNGYGDSPHGSRSSLHLHKIAAQSLLNGSTVSSFATPPHFQTPPLQCHTPPNHVQTTPPDVQRLIQLLQAKNGAQQGWHSMNGLVAGSAGGSRQSLWTAVAVSPDQSPEMPSIPSIVVTPDQPEMPSTPRVVRHVDQLNTPQGQHGHRARSMEGLLEDHTNQKDSLHIPRWTDRAQRTPVRQFCASDTDLTCSTKRQARRQIDFSDDRPSQQLLALPKAGVGRRRASMPEMPLTTLLEEDEFEMSDDLASRADGVLEWEYGDLPPIPNRCCTVTM